jgi:hypothetical protein
LSAGSASGSELNVPLPSRFFCVGLCRYSAIELPPELLYDFPQVVSVVLEITPNLFDTRRLGFRFFLGWRGSWSIMAQKIDEPVGHP